MADQYNQVVNYFSNHKYCICETVVFSLGPLSAIIAAKFGGFRTWLRYEIAVSFLIGLALFCEPFAVFTLKQLQGTNKEIISYHSFLCALYGCYLIYSALFPLFFYQSKDETIYFGHFWSKIVSSTLIVIENYFSYLNGNAWSYKLLCLSTSYFLFNILINVCFLIKSKKPVRLPPFNDFIDHVAKLESYMLLSAGLILYAFPDQGMIGVNFPSEIHRSLCRTCGALLFSLSFESFCLSDFVFLADKKTFMLARLTGSLVELFVILLGYFYYRVFTAYPALAIYLFINLSYNMLVLVGYLSVPKNVHQPNANDKTTATEEKAGGSHSKAE